MRARAAAFEWLVTITCVAIGCGTSGSSAGPDATVDSTIDDTGVAPDVHVDDTISDVPAVPPDEPPPIPIGFDASRMWDRWPYLRIGQRTYMRSTYDRSGGNEAADA